MAGHVGAPISAVLQLEPAVTAAQITATLADWLQKTHSVELEPADHEGLMVEWRAKDEDPFACQLVASDSHDRARRTITVTCDDADAVAIVEEAPFASPDASHAAVDLSEPVQLLLGLLLPMAKKILDLSRGDVNDLHAVDSDTLITALHKDLSPGLLIAVTTNEEDAPSSAQQDLLDDLVGLAFVGTLPAGAALLTGVGLSTPPRAGSVVSIARTIDGLDAQVIASTSLRTKPDSARRLVVRRQLSAPVPFDLERRRSSAMTRLLSSGSDIDLPTALQLLDDESQRANERSNRVKELETLLERAYEEQDSALGELENTQSQVRYLQKAFKELGEVPLVEAEDDEDWLPESSVDALVAARESLPFLMIGATEDSCILLDAHQKRGIWAKKIWSSLRALNDYCRAKAEGRFNGDIAMYRDNTPDGAIPLLAEYAPAESKSTTDDASLVAARTFVVATDVHPAGKTYMEQHVKIDKGGQSAPRIHLYDDSGGATQRIYIGYVGPHLPTAGGF
jgi:hypothetical protein